MNKQSSLCKSDKPKDKSQSSRDGSEYFDCDEFPAEESPLEKSPSSKPNMDKKSSLGRMRREELTDLSLTKSIPLWLQHQSEMQRQQMNQQMEMFQTILTKQHSNDGYRSKPDIFTGNGDWEWADYEAHFEEVSRCNGWDEKRMAAVLATRIKDKAIQAWRDKYPDVPPSFSYKLLVSCMRERFQPKGMIEAHKAELHVRRKKTGETFMDHACTLRRLAMKAYPNFNGEAREELVKDHFVKNLSEPDMRKMVGMAHPKSLEEAISLATEYETHIGNTAPRKPVAPVGTDKKSRAVDLENVQCYGCREWGHYRNDCPKKGQGNKQNTGQKNPGKGNQGLNNQGNLGNGAAQGQSNPSFTGQGFGQGNQNLLGAPCGGQAFGLNYPLNMISQLNQQASTQVPSASANQSQASGGSSGSTGGN